MFRMGYIRYIIVSQRRRRKKKRRRKYQKNIPFKGYLNKFMMCVLYIIISGYSGSEYKEKVFHNVDEIPLISIFGKLIYISLRQVPNSKDIKMFIKGIMWLTLLWCIKFLFTQGFIMSNNRRNPLDL